MSAAVAQAQGFGPVLKNKPFRNLWAAQVLAQTAQNAINFVLIVLIERLTGASIHQGLMILAFTLPGILFAPVSGIIIDRWPKKWILVGSNALRVVSVLSYIVVLEASPGHSTWWLLIAVYTIAFITATVGQFFNPAEAAMIPLLVGRDLLIPANSLFTLTLAVAQVMGLVILGPLSVKLIGVEAAFVFIAGMYFLAALSVSRLPRDEPTRLPQAAKTGWQRARSELREGAEFVVTRPPILVAMIHLTLIASLVMVLAMLAPGIASRVLHLAPEDAIVVFAPAGLGMLLAAVLLGRWGYRLSKRRLAKVGLVAITVGFLAFGWLAWRLQTANIQLALDLSVMALPPASAALILATVLLSLFLGFSMSGVNIVSQTILQERSPERLRGRVFTVQFMLNNLVGIPPMLAIGGLADLIGIPQVLVGVGVVVAGVLAVTLTIERRSERRSP
jgi:MFS family permease